MYVEERIYALQAGAAPEYLRHYEAEGVSIQTKHLPHLVGYYFTEAGPLNTIVHMWAYDDLNQREKCRPQLQADPAWRAYTAKVRPLVVSQENRLLKCAPFFVERLKKMLAAVE